MAMTYDEIYRRLTDQFTRAGCESAAFDASCLLEHFGGLTRAEMSKRGGDPVPEDIARQLTDAAEQRAAGRPLQYILGEWDFLSLTLEVGEGVLIPRPDTESLCETAASMLKGQASPRVLDLCAGSGCVGLGIASLCPGALVTALELSDGAFDYLRRNCARYPQFSVTPVKADVLRDAAQFRDACQAIVSNPPYIPERDLPSLMQEVQREPEMALNGGDGYRFYRAIFGGWAGKLAAGGFCAVEVGVGQAAMVSAMMEAAGLTQVRIVRDYGGVERVVAGIKGEK